MGQIEEYLNRRAEDINRALNFYMPKSPAMPVIEAMLYSAEAGGKRLRPILTLATAETLEGDVEAVMPVAVAVEMIHTYSLIHDDLPSMDDSDLRRGRPSCHIAHGEAMAILAGDGLLTLAFELVSGYGMANGNPEKALIICRELARASGVEGMIGGQVLDLQAEGKKLELHELEQLHALKTGALLTCSVRCGAIAADADDDCLQALTVYASKLGLAFQIVDDLLDLSGTAETLGKMPGDDRAHQKSTYPALIGVEESQRKAEELYGDALQALDTLKKPAPLLEGLAGKLVFRDR